MNEVACGACGRFELEGVSLFYNGFKALEGIDLREDGDGDGK